jgi:hypothetical protein
VNDKEKGVNLKSVAVVDGAIPDEVMFFSTVKEAQEYIEELCSVHDSVTKAHIYTLLSVGEPVREFAWTLQTDTNINMLENKKAKAKPRRKGGWSELEVKTLTDAIIKGTPTGKIAKQLHRSAGSVYQKAVKLGLKGKGTPSERKPAKELKKKNPQNW